jgi:hypothetical protein
VACGRVDHVVRADNEHDVRRACESSARGT